MRIAHRSLLAASIVAVTFAFTTLSARVAAQSAAPPNLKIVESDSYITTTIADGVYTLRHRRAIQMGSLCGNTTVVVGDRDVLVVDACTLPTLVDEDIAMIRAWTAKPVRYLVNTHWHGDHTFGNGTYAKAFPGLSIIAHPETTRQMAGYLPTFLERNRNLPQLMRRALETRVDLDGQPLTTGREAEIRDDQANAAVRSEIFKTMTTVLPNVTVDGRMTIDLGGRVVDLQYLGRGNTGGDLVVTLPKERIAIAGDLLVMPFPFLLGGFPSEWSRTLGRLDDLDASVVVPGHGAVLAGDDARSYVRLIRDLLGVVSKAVQEEAFRRDNGSAHLEAIKAAVATRADVLAIRARFAARNAALLESFDGSLPALVTSAYREAWGG